MRVSISSTSCYSSHDEPGNTGWCLADLPYTLRSDDPNKALSPLLPFVDISDDLRASHPVYAENIFADIWHTGVDN
jgi:hypothetical protein